MLFFGPNDKKVGKQFFGDPNGNENVLTLGRFSILDWLERFPHWHLSAKLMPKTPLPSGVAIQRAAAISEGKDPDKAVEEALRDVSFSPFQPLA
jgi:hypothetical protein